IQYTHRKLTDPGIQSRKISFVLGVKDLQWLVGAGVYIDDVESDIARMQAQLNHQLKIKFLFFSMTVTAILGLFYLFFRSLNRRLKNDVELLVSFFKRAANSDEAIDQEHIKFAELGQMAKYANQMLVDRKLSADAAGERSEIPPHGRKFPGYHLPNVDS
ncbi:cache domain-containing protein, partial [Desulfosarcina cetonica]|uniref:cache domain-containing protein n=1 Tax=Desulfosarcina cetonica TaxID=90730 RepID=UPI001C49145F